MFNQAELFPSLQTTVDQLFSVYDQIPNDRKIVLRQLSDFVSERLKAGRKVSLNFICTHNSRRSHMAQIWAQTAAYYFDIPNVECYSGGTEATAFNLRAVKAMQNVGFKITELEEGTNPRYEVLFSNTVSPVIAFSKKYDDPSNPNKDFAAIMTCSQADENCPVVSGASARVAITYDDPKDFDGTSREEAKYKERALQIGREMLFAFNQIANV